MDAIQPVGAMIQPPNPNQGLNAYSTLLGIQSQRLGIQQQEQGLQGQAALVSQEQQKNQQLTALRDFTVQAAQDPAYKNEDGSFNVQKFQQDAMAKTGPHAFQYIGQASSNANAAVENRKALLALSNEQRQTIGGYLGAVAANPNATRADLKRAISQARGVSDDKSYQSAIDDMLMGMAPINGMSDADASQSIRQVARQGAMAVGAANTSASNPAITNYTTPSGDVGYQQSNPQNPMGLGKVGPTVGQGLAPQLGTYPNQQVGIFKGGGPGGAGSGGGGGGKTQTTGLPAMTRPAPNAPGADQENYKARVKQLGEEYQAVSSAANDATNGVQATRYRNQRILDLAPHAGTGPHMGSLNTIISRLPGTTGDDYQDLAHYTAQNSAAMAKLMGVPNTNMGQETAAAAAGNVERNPGTLMEITKANDALNTGFDLYNRGLAKVTNNGSDMSRAASYKQAFGQNVDVAALRWADAHRRGDQEEIQALRQKYGEAGIAQFQQKLKTLKALAEKGDIS